jgi:hypothetical protein
MDSGEARAKLDELLKAFGVATGVPSLATEENGVCILVFDKRTRLYLVVDHSTGNLVLWSTLGAVPSDTAEATLRALMRANVFWTGTQGAILGLMPDSDDVVLSIRRPVAEVDVEGLRDLIELMVERIEALTPIATGDLPSGESAQPAPSFSSAIRG